METHRIIYLYQRYRERLISDEEREELEILIEDINAEEVLKQFWAGQWDRISFQDQQKVVIPGYERIYDEIIASEPKKAAGKKSVWPRIAAVAAAVAFIISGVYFFSYNHKLNTTAYQNDVQPGKMGATLTLANGRKILISDVNTGDIARQSGVKISKTADGQLIYEAISGNSNALEYNTLSTIRGEQTQVRLPDGSTVFLNAASSLKYPASFAGLKQREVTLTGEAYFEIAKDKIHPFIVHTASQKAEVLGTHFNISSYAGEGSVKTTLLEGSVRVSSLRDALHDEAILKPNQQSVVTGHDPIKVTAVDASDAIDWKNGKFICDNMALGELLTKVGRWYNVDFIYADHDVLDDKVTGTLSRTANISKLLNRIALTGEVKFEIKDRTIKVLKK